MSTTDEEKKTHQKHTQLLMELPQTGGWWSEHIFLYQIQWLLSRALLSAMIMQNNFEPHSTDIFLSSFPKSGTTWLRALMFSTLHRSRFDFSNHPLLSKAPRDCFPVLDYHLSEEDNDVVLPSPRLFATHFAHTLFPTSSGYKFVYVCRDPKDAFVSLWYFIKKFSSNKLPTFSFDEAFGLFCQGIVEYGSYWDHVLGYWKASLESPEKVLFLKYEELKRELEVHVKRLAEFLGTPFSVEKEEHGVVEKIVNLCSFEHLKNLEVNKSGIQRISTGIELPNHCYFRRGEVGDSERHLTKVRVWLLV